MVTVNFSVPDDVKEVFDRTFSEEERNTVIAELMRKAAEESKRQKQEVIRRRFHSGWKNFNDLYKPLVNAWFLFDNSGSEPVLLAKGVNP